MNEILKFLKDCGTFYLATAEENGQPRVRPFGAVCAFDGKLYLITANTKDVYKQLVANPKAEISGMAGDKWLRLTAELIRDERREAKVAMLEENPSLNGMYSPDDGVMEVFYLQNAIGTICSFTSEPVVYTF